LGELSPLLLYVVVEAGGGRKKRVDQEPPSVAPTFGGTGNLKIFMGAKILNKGFSPRITAEWEDGKTKREQLPLLRGVGKVSKEESFYKKGYQFFSILGVGNSQGDEDNHPQRSKGVQG